MKLLPKVVGEPFSLYEIVLIHLNLGQNPLTYYPTIDLQAGIIAVNSFPLDESIVVPKRMKSNS